MYRRSPQLQQIRVEQGSQRERLLQGVLEEVTLLQEIVEAVRNAVRAFVEDRTDKDGRVSLDSLNNFARNLGFQEQPWTRALKVIPHSLFELLNAITSIFRLIGTDAEIL